MDDLVNRGGLYYKQLTDVPFTGEVNGISNGSVKNGVRDGTWISYNENGQLYTKGNYKNGKREGAWVTYYKNGRLMYKGTWKNDKREGAWVSYNNDGTVDKKYTGTFKDGKKISD